MGNAKGEYAWRNHSVFNKKEKKPNKPFTSSREKVVRYRKLFVTLTSLENNKLEQLTLLKEDIDELLESKAKAQCGIVMPHTIFLFMMNDVTNLFP